MACEGLSQSAKFQNNMAAAGQQAFIGDMEKSTTLMQRIVKEAIPYRHPSQLLFSNDWFDEALSLLLRSTEIHPVPEAYTLIGQIHINKGNPERAIIYLEKALELSKEVNRQLIDLLAKAYLQAGQHEKFRQLTNR